MKKYKIIISMLFVLIMLCILQNNVKATSAIVNTDTLKLRKEPSLEAIVLDLLSLNDKLEVIEKDGDWYKIKFKGITGYVSKDYIKLEEEDTTITKEPNNEEEQVSETTEEVKDYNNKEMYINKDNDIYILPLIYAKKIDIVKQNQQVNVRNEINGWSYIFTEEIAGWIRTDILTDKIQNNKDNNTNNNNNEDTKTEESSQPVYQSRTGYISEPSVYVRSKPTTESDIVDSLIKNNTVTIIGEEGDWYHVKVDGKEGYIAKRLVSDKKETETSRSLTVQRENILETKTEEEPVDKTQQLKEFVQQFLGCSYRYGGEGPNYFDCSGFIMYVYKQFGYSLSHSATAQSKQGIAVDKKDIQVGDIVIFKDEENQEIGHCGIYIGDGNFIHASSGAGKVTVTPLEKQYYSTRYVTARRILI